MKYERRLEFFNALGGRTVNEIRDRVLFEAQNNKTRYNELVKDFEDYINSHIGLGPDISTTKTEKDFADHRAQELQPLTRGEVWHYENIEHVPPYKLVFDFITIEPNNSVKASRLKASCRPHDERERISNYVYRAFNFREGCKLAIAELLDPQQAIEPTTANNKAEKTFFDFIDNVKNKEAFANDLKDTFNTETGIEFKIMIELLKDEKIFLISDRGFAGFYRAIKPHFSQDIGTRTGLNDLYKHNAAEQKHYAGKVQIIKERLNPLIYRHKA